MKLVIVVLLLACHVYVEGIIRRRNVERAKRSAETTTAEGTGLLMARNTADLKSFKLDKVNANLLKKKRSHEKGIEDRSLERLPAEGKHGRAHNLGGKRKLLGSRADDEYYARIRRISPISVWHRNRDSITTQGGARYLSGTRNLLSENDYDYDNEEPSPPKEKGPYISPWYRHKDGTITGESTRNLLSDNDYDYDNEEPSPPKEKGPYISPWYRHKDGTITGERAGFLDSITDAVRNFFISVGESILDFQRRRASPTFGKGGNGPFHYTWYGAKRNMMPEERARRLGGARKVNDYRRMLKSTSHNKRSLPHDRSHYSERLNSREISEKDKKALLHPCTLEHYAFARRREKQGCKGAVAFVRKVCDDFFDCLLKRTSSATKCESKICDKFYAAEREDHCYDELFQCY